MATEIKQVKKKVYLALKEVDASQKCPPQARLIMETISKAGGKIDRDELVTLLKRPVEEGGLKTNQTAERILGFYKPKLVEMGVLHEDEDVTEIEVEVADKPAPEATSNGAEPAAEKPRRPKKGEHKTAEPVVA